MKLRYKLVLLHSAFALFAVLTAAATIYGVQLHVRNTGNSFESIVNKSNQVERLSIEAQAQLVHLREIALGERQITDNYMARRDAFFTRLREFGDFADAASTKRAWQRIDIISRRLQESFDEYLELLAASDSAGAAELLSEKIESDLHIALQTRLANIRSALEEARHGSVDAVSTTNIVLLALTGFIGLACIAFLITSSFLVRRWLLTPIKILQNGTSAFANGDLDYRLDRAGDDEFGSLSDALNSMASSLAASQAKYRSLFENLRDAVIICDPEGIVVECRDSDTKILDVDPQAAIGRQMLEVWHHWESAEWDWRSMLARVAHGREQVRGVGVLLSGEGVDRPNVDIIAYPVQYGGTQNTAIVLRDATERHRLLRLERRADTMVAAETFARGITHDFKNLLNSVVATLSIIRSEPLDVKNTGRAVNALEACRQAVSLSNRLLRFSCSDEGHPESVHVGEMIDVVLGSLEEPFRKQIQVETSFDPEASAFVDRDHLTQIILNLLGNAREAMPDGGRLHIATSAVTAANPLTSQPASGHVLLSVTDSGCGMSSPVIERVFEPLFSTKPRGPEGVRGLGLPFVYAAVRHAGGFIQLQSEVGVGTTFEIYLPSDGRSLTIKTSRPAPSAALRGFGRA